MLEINKHKSLETRKKSGKSRTIERKWDTDSTSKLIQMIAAMPHIWNPSDDYYKDFRKREFAFKEIGMTLNRSINDCKAKYDNLRTQFFFHYRKALRCEDGEGSYSVKWKYYRALYFLSTLWKPSNPSLSNIAKAENSINCDDYENSQSSNMSLYASQDEKKVEVEPKNVHPAEQEEIFFAFTPNSYRKSDSAQIFGDFVADRLRYMRQNKAELVKNKIMKILLDASIRN